MASVAKKLSSVLKAAGVKNAKTGKDISTKEIKSVQKSSGSSKSTTTTPTVSTSDSSGSKADASVLAPFITAGKETEAESILNKDGYTLGSAVTTSDTTRADDSNINANLSNLEKKVKGETITLPDGSTTTKNPYSKLINDRIDELEARYERETERIKADYKSEKESTEETQRREAGATGAGVLRMGGYLGESGSGTGVMLTQAKQHRDEVQSLLSKRDKALSDARTAYENNNFDLSKLLVETATKAEEQAYERSQDYFKNQMTLANFNIDKIENDLKVLSFMDLDDLSDDPDALSKLSEIDSYYKAPGFSLKYIEAAKEARNADTTKDQLAVDKAYLDILSDIPYGQTVVLPDGRTYTGLKVSKTASTGPNVPMTLQRAIDLGLPDDVVGMTEKDLVFSLELDNPPSWYVKSQVANLNQSFASDQALYDTIKKDWGAFRNQPDIQTYRNTIRLDYRTGLPSSQDDLAEIQSAIQALSGE